jgi:putative ABC transport system permease protein
MIHWWGGWRVALRIARREAWRAAGRSTLVLLMIALPVAALAFTAVQHDTFTLSPTERADRLMGTAEAVLAWPIDTAVAQDPADLEMWSNIDPGQGGGSDGPASMDRLLALLPSGSRLIPDQRGDLRMATLNGTGTIDARALDYADPLAAGILRPISGRPPAAADDVALTAQAATRLGAGVGGTVRLADGSRTFHVTAIVENPWPARRWTGRRQSGSPPSRRR